MTKVQRFEHPELGTIRTIIMDGEPWFVCGDIGKALWYRSPQGNILYYVSEENRKRVSNEKLNPVTPITVINEAGLKQVLSRSRQPTVDKLRRWVTEEILPALHASSALDALERGKAASSECNSKGFIWLTSLTVGKILINFNLVAAIAREDNESRIFFAKDSNDYIDYINVEESLEEIYELILSGEREVRMFKHPEAELKETHNEY